MVGQTELVAWLTSHLLCRRIRTLQVGEPLLQRPEVAHELIVLGIGDDGGIKDMVAVVVIADRVAELLDGLPRGPLVLDRLTRYLGLALVFSHGLSSSLEQLPQVTPAPRIEHVIRFEPASTGLPDAEAHVG